MPAVDWVSSVAPSTIPWTGKAAVVATGPRKRTAATRLAVALDGPLAAPEALRAAVEGALLGAYRFDRYRKKDDAPRAALRKVALAVPAQAADGDGAAEAVAERG